MKSAHVIAGCCAIPRSLSASAGRFPPLRNFPECAPPRRDVVPKVPFLNIALEKYGKIGEGVRKNSNVVLTVGILILTDGEGVMQAQWVIPECVESVPWGFQAEPTGLNRTQLNLPLLVMLGLGRQQNRLVLLHLDHAFRPQVKL